MMRTAPDRDLERPSTRRPLSFDGHRATPMSTAILPGLVLGLLVAVSTLGACGRETAEHESPPAPPAVPARLPPPCTSGATCFDRRLALMNEQAELLERVHDEASARAIEIPLATTFREMRRVADVVERLPPEQQAIATIDSETRTHRTIDRLGRAHGRASVIDAARPILVRAMIEGSARR